jgi:hypothetical protein
MKNHVPFLDTNDMEWQPGELPGLFTKLLSSDGDSGARTALQCIDPARGYVAPDKPHYHGGDEEIFGLKGRFSFDSENWLGRYSYCFHPARTVHGFNSAVTEESWFISRVRQDLEFSFADDYRDRIPYNLDDEQPEREVSVLFDPLNQAWKDVVDSAGNLVLRRLVLSEHPLTGEGSMLVEFLPGWVSPHGDHYHSVYEEAFVVEGELLARDGQVFSAGCYSFKPPHAIQSALSSPKGAIAYITYGGALDFRPASELSGA